MVTLLLDRDVVGENTCLPDIIQAIERAFAAYDRGNAQMPPKSYIDLPKYFGDFRSMPAYLDVGDWDAAGIKWVNAHPNNPENFGLPTVMGTYIYSNPENAYPMAIMDGTELTRQRTGAAAAVATDHLALPDASSLGIIGAGAQSYPQLEAISEVRTIDTVIVSDVRTEAKSKFIRYFSDYFDVRDGTISEAASCDILSTVTPVRDPLVFIDDLGPHTHVNAMGADAPGKQELEGDILLNAKVVIDDFDQCVHSGEINVPLKTGEFHEDEIYCELGEIINGRIPGRSDGDEITVFDSTGLAIQDVAAAKCIYERAKKTESGVSFDLLSLGESP